MNFRTDPRCAQAASSRVRRPGTLIAGIDEFSLNENQRRALATARLQLRIDGGLSSATSPAERRPVVAEARMDAKRGKLDG